MEYQKIVFFSDNTPNQLSIFRANNWVEINDEHITPIAKLTLKIQF